MMTDKMEWTNKPEGFSISDDRIEITTMPYTDLWQRTYYGFRNDNAPMLQFETDERYFSFLVRADFSGFHNRFDQCGIVLYLDSDNWLKASVEYENEVYNNLGSVVTNNGYSDWAMTETPADVKAMWYRLSRREDDFLIECALEKTNEFSPMRVCHLAKGGGTIRFGVYACSPGDSSFKAVFTGMEMTECTWKAHE